MSEQTKDSIIVSKSLQIDELKIFVETGDIAISKLDQELTKSNDDLQKMKKKRKRALIWGGAGTGVAILEGILLWFGLK